MNRVKDLFSEEAAATREQEAQAHKDAWMDELEHNINEALTDRTDRSTSIQHVSAEQYLDSDAIMDLPDSDQEIETEAMEPPRTTEDEEEGIETAEDEEDEGRARVGSKRPIATVDEDSEREATSRSHKRARFALDESDESD